MHTLNKLEIIDNKEKLRFEVKLDNDFGYVDYRWRDDVFALMFIYIPPQYRGKGISEALIKFVLDYARENNLKIKVYCSWIAGYIRSHPEYHALLIKV